MRKAKGLFRKLFSSTDRHTRKALCCVVDPATGRVKECASFSDLKLAFEEAVKHWKMAHYFGTAAMTLAMCLAIWTVYDLDERATSEAKSAKKKLETAKKYIEEKVMPKLRTDSTNSDLCFAKLGLEVANDFTDAALDDLQKADAAASRQTVFGSVFAIAGFVGACAFAPLAIGGYSALGVGAAVEAVVVADAVSTVCSGVIAVTGVTGIVRGVKHKKDLLKLKKELRVHCQRLAQAERVYDAVISSPAATA